MKIVQGQVMTERSSKRPRPGKIDINEDLTSELFNSPTMRGLVSFLNVKPTQQTHDGPQEASSQSSPTVGLDSEPTVGQEDTSRSKVGEILTGIQTSQLPDVNAKTLSIPGVTHTKGASEIVEISSMPGGLESRPTVGLISTPTVTRVVVEHFRAQRLLRAQDGHSELENRMYEALWAAATPVVGEDFRLITVGYERAGKLARTEKKNAKRTLQTLIEKLAIEQVASENVNERTGRTYKVYTYKTTIRRRRDAGYEYFIRNRGGVILRKVADLTGGPDAEPTGGLDVQPTVSLYTSPTVGDESLTGGADIPPTVGTEPPGTGGSEPPSYIRKQFNKTLSSSSSDIAALATEIRKITDDVDDVFLKELLERCRDVCADCTLEEIRHFAQIKARYRGINKSFTGFLLKAVPQCLTGEAFRQYRDAVQAQKESERNELRRMKKESHDVLMDRGKREHWEIENAQDTQNYLRQHHAWLFESDTVETIHARPVDQTE